MRELALNFLDLAQNSLAAGATKIVVRLALDRANDRLLFRIGDNGRGMRDPQAALSPFYTTRSTRDAGLGLPLLKAEAERTGGSLAIRSQPGKGTEVAALFHPSHIDMVPLGDMAGVLRLLRVCNPAVTFLFQPSVIARKGSKKHSTHF